MDQRKEKRHTRNFHLSLDQVDPPRTVTTHNISWNGLAIELSSNMKMAKNQTLHFTGKFKEAKAHFSAMVKWYRRELNHHLMGLQIVNPPAFWTNQFSDVNDSRPIFQLHFGHEDILTTEYTEHLSQGMLEVSPTPRVPSINAEVIVEVFLPGSSKPERVEGRVAGHIAGGFHIKLRDPQSLINKVKTVLA